MLRYLVSLKTLDVYVMLYSSWGAGYKTIYTLYVVRLFAESSSFYQGKYIMQ